MYSRKYDNGAIWTACCECNRGGNGGAVHKCSAGGHIKKWDKLGCFAGELSMAQIKEISGPIRKWNGIQEAI